MSCSFNKLHCLDEIFCSLSEVNICCRWWALCTSAFLVAFCLLGVNGTSWETSWNSTADHVQKISLSGLKMRSDLLSSVWTPMRTYTRFVSGTLKFSHYVKTLMFQKHNELRLISTEKCQWLWTLCEISLKLHEERNDQDSVGRFTQTRGTIYRFTYQLLIGHEGLSFTCKFALLHLNVTKLKEQMLEEI